MSTPDTTVELLDKSDRAEQVIKAHLLWTGAAGIIPIPWVDTVAVAGIQVKMLQKIGMIYGQTLSTYWVKATIGSLTSGYVAMSIGKGFGLGIVGAVPLVGGLAKLLLAPGMAAATTYALGRIFIMHFESGGTMLDFDAHKYADKMKEMVAKGNTVVKELTPTTLP